MAGSSTEVFTTRLDHRMSFDAELQQSTSPVNLLPRIIQALEISIILCDAPRDYSTVHVTIVPIDQVSRVCYILCNRLL